MPLKSLALILINQTQRMFDNTMEITLANLKDITIPDIGGAEKVDVIEIFVKAGDSITKEDPLVTLESDKATMDIPAPLSGTVKEVKIKVGDKVSQGSVVLTLEEAAGSEPPAAPVKQEPAASKPVENKSSSESLAPTQQTIYVPDIGGANNVDVIDIAINVGDEINVDDTLMTLESEKASMDIPSPFSGKIASINIKVGDKVSQGQAICDIITSQATAEKQPEPLKQTTATEAAKPAAISQVAETIKQEDSGSDVHASPSVRRIAREFGVDLSKVSGTGRKGRIMTEDVQKFVKNALQQAGSGGGFALPKAPQVDFTKFGEVDIQPLNKIKRLTGQNLHASWITVPHVTQFDEADITELENFRSAHKNDKRLQGAKLTPLVFIMKAVVKCLQQLPKFNSSLDQNAENLIMKKYFHIGVAVDTPNGLVVPVVRNVDQKGLFELAIELKQISEKARDKKLMPNDMQGSCFTISSLGGISGTGFTPIVNMPDVAILGVSKSKMQPVYINNEFIPRLILPLSLSYDHRVIDGADGARFTLLLANYLSDIRELLL